MRINPHLLPSSVLLRINGTIYEGYNLTLPVVWFMERHRREDSFTQLLPHVHRHLCSLLMPARLDITHGNIFTQRWRWDT